MSPPYSPMLDFSLLHGHVDAGFTRWEWYEDQLGCSLLQAMFPCALGCTLLGVVAVRCALTWSAKGREVERLTEENGKQQELICELEARVADLRAHIRCEAADGHFSTASTPARNDPAPPQNSLITTNAGLKIEPAAAGCAAAQTELENHADDRASEPDSPPAMRITTPCNDLVPYDAPPWVGEATDEMLSLLEAANPSKPQQLILPSTSEDVETYTPHYTDYAVNSTLPTSTTLAKCTKPSKKDHVMSQPQHVERAITLRVEDRVVKAATGGPRGWTQKDQERGMQVAVVMPENAESKSLGGSVEESGVQRWESSSGEESEGEEDFEEEESDDDESWKLEH
ncbi:hypothetical protein LTR95_016613 [Oleoguttula sp. CCFEE 5521]